MGVQSPIEFALQHQVDGVWQLLDNYGNLARRRRPVLAKHSIATADHLRQPTFAINQGHRDAIYLGLNPHVLPRRQPGHDCLFVQEFFQACVGDRVAQGAS